MLNSSKRPVAITGSLGSSAQRRPAMITADNPEPFHSIKEAAEILNIQSWKLQRAAKEGIIPIYRLFNTRRMVRISEIVDAITQDQE